MIAVKPGPYVCADPLNGEAAALLMREPEAYNQKVKGVHNLVISSVTQWHFALLSFKQP